MAYRKAFLRVAAPIMAAVLGSMTPGAVRAEEGAVLPIQAGDCAAEFELDPDLAGTFGYSSSATLSIKHHHSSSRALRFGASIGFYEDQGDGHHVEVRYDPPIYPSSTPVSGPSDRHSEAHSYAAFVHLVHEKPLSSALAVFLEAGPRLQYDEQKSSNHSIYSIPAPYYYDLDYFLLQRRVGIDAKLGFEWFFSHRLSLGARYGIFASYNWGGFRNTYDNYDLAGTFRSYSKEEYDTHGASVNTLRSTVTLAAYF